MYLCGSKICPHYNNSTMNIIIIANGSFPTLPTVLQQLNTADLVVCCDGALANYLRWYRQQSLRPSHLVAVVGDGDSLSPALLQEAQRENIQLDHQQIDEQEYNDLTKAVRYAVAQCHGQKANISILGATGKREDHTLGNISLLAYYMEEFSNCDFSMPGDYGTFYPMQGSRTFASQAGQQISLFSLQPEIPITVSGLRYPIENRKINWWWEATLNEAEGESFTVTGGRMLVYIKH